MRQFKALPVMQDNQNNLNNRFEQKNKEAFSD